MSKDNKQRLIEKDISTSQKETSEKEALFTPRHSSKILNLYNRHLVAKENESSDNCQPIHDLTQIKQISPKGSSEVTSEPDPSSCEYEEQRSSSTIIAPPRYIHVSPPSVSEDRPNYIQEHEDQLEEVLQLFSRLSRTSKATNQACTSLCEYKEPQAKKSLDSLDRHKNLANGESRFSFWHTKTAELANDARPLFEEHKSSSASNTSIAPPRVINVIPPQVLEDVLQATMSPEEDLREDRDQLPDEESEPSSQLANEQGMGLPKHSVAVIPELSPPLSGTIPDRDTMIGNMVSMSVQTDDGETPDRDNMRGNMVTVAVQTDDDDYDSHTFGIAPTTATIFVSGETGEPQPKMDYKVYQRESWSILQELDGIYSRQTPSPVDKKEADETTANKTLEEKTSNFFHDGVFSNELLKELADIGPKDQPTGMASSSLRLLIDNLTAKIHTSPTDEPTLETVNENPDENLEQDEDVPPIFRKGSFDISPHDPAKNDNFNTISEPLREANQLPSQLHARRERLQQRMLEQRRQTKKQGSSLLKIKLQRAAKSIKKGLCSAAKKCVMCRTKHKQ